MSNVGFIMISDVVAVRILGLDRSTFEKQQSEAAEDEVKSNKISKKKNSEFRKISKNGSKSTVSVYSALLDQPDSILVTRFVESTHRLIKFKSF